MDSCINMRKEAENFTPKPCNPYGLEKRIRGQKCNGKEALEYLNVADSDKLNQIRDAQNQNYVRSHTAGSGRQLSRQTTPNYLPTTKASPSRAKTVTLSQIPIITD